MLISRAKRRIFESEVLPYFGKKWQEGIKKREILQKKLLYLVGFSTITEFLEKISPKTCAIFIQGGTGTRWRDSLGNKNNLSLIDNYDIDKKNPRSIVRIANFLPGVPGNRRAKYISRV